MDSQKIKYQEFVRDDLLNNKGRLLNACEELKSLLNNPELNNIFSKHYLNDILTYATNFSEFYQKYKGFHDILEFPIMRKQDLKDNWETIEVKQYRQDQECVTKYTSGSTGTPFKMVLDKYKHCRWIAGNKVFREINGIKSHDKTVFISANILDKKIPFERQEKDNVYYLDYTYLSEQEFDNLFNYLIENNVVTMTAIASVYDQLARFIRNNKNLKWSGKITALFSISELLKETTRKEIEDFFSCPLYSLYANEENGVFGVEDGSGNGFLANIVDYNFEVLSMESDEPVKEGEVGRLVITDYFNKAFPMIRYENGDLVAMKRMEDGKVYFTKIVGRIADVLYTTKGKMVDIFHAISFLEPYMDIKQFQLVQHSFNDFTWILNTDNHGYEGMIVKYSKEIFGQDSNWNFKYVKEIPKLRSGKFRMTICEISEDD